MTSATTTTGGRPRPAARQRRMARLGRLSFMAVFLGLPLAIYLIFVIYPFGQALYYAMTDWNGFSPAYDFVGLEETVGSGAPVISKPDFVAAFISFSIQPPDG